MDASPIPPRGRELGLLATAVLVVVLIFVNWEGDLSPSLPYEPHRRGWAC